MIPPLTISPCEGALDIAYRIALIHADISEYLLESISGRKEQARERRQQILGDFAHLEKPWSISRALRKSGYPLLIRMMRPPGKQHRWIRSLLMRWPGMSTLT